MNRDAAGLGLAEFELTADRDSGAGEHAAKTDRTASPHGGEYVTGRRAGSEAERAAGRGAKKKIGSATDHSGDSAEGAPANAGSKASGGGVTFPAQISLVCESRDGRLCLFSDAHGHLTAVRASRLA